MKYDSRLHKRRRRLLHAFGEGVGGATDPDVIAYLAAIEAAGITFSLQKELAFDAFYKALKAESGLYDSFDGHHVRWVTGNAALSEAAYKINMLTPGTYDLTKVGGVTFSDDGVLGNGTDGYLDTGFNPSTSGGAWSLNSAHLGVFIAASSGAGGSDATAGANAAMNIRATADNNWYRGINDTINAIANAVYTGHFVNSRVVSTHRQDFRDGSRTQNEAVASTSVSNATVRFLRGGSSFNGTRTQGACHYGGGHTTVQAGAHFSALITLLQNTL